MWLAYAIAGLVMYLLVVTIPFGCAAFRIANYALWPFGRTVVSRPDAGAPSFIGYVLWFVCAGVWIATAHLVTSVLLMISVIGIRVTLPSSSPEAGLLSRQSRCVNCDGRYQGAPASTPLCSLACESQARTVRAFRSAFATYGRHSLPPEVEQGLRIQMAHALASGDSPAQYRPQAAREYISARDGGRCALCSSPATEIDHVGDLSEPPNLRLLCSGCHATSQSLSHGRHGAVRTDAEIDALFNRLISRVDAPTPTRACDAGDWGPQGQRRCALHL